MNQFKKAKQKQIESGKTVESVNDLHTAGVDYKEETPKAIETDLNIESTNDVNSQNESNIVEEKITSTLTLEKNITEENIIDEFESENPEETIAEEKQIEETPLPIPVVVSLPQEEIHVTAIPTISPKAEETVTYSYIKAPDEPVKTNKSNVPNIFSPKEEAKSTRKSLVLKPSSVRKAESYCRKNGGSFNELVQTLLDNFITEYDL